LKKVYYKTRQNFITKCGSFIYYKTQQKIITKRGSFFITKRVVFITKRGRYYKTRQVLQNAAGITNALLLHNAA